MRLDNDEDFDFLEEDEKGKKLMWIVSGVVVVGVAAVLCFFLWRFTHSSTVKGDNESAAKSSLSVEGQLASDNSTGEESQDGVAGVRQSGSGTDVQHSEAGRPESGQGSQHSEAGQPESGQGSQHSEAGQPGAGQGSQHSEAGRPESGQGSQHSEAGRPESGQDSQHSGNGTAGGAQASSAEDMQFQEANDTVTAKDTTNLRTEPSTAGDDTVAAKLKNGETVTRTGINEASGWSRVEYNGQALYAVTRFLTTDLTPKQSQSASLDSTDTGSRNSVKTKDGRTVQFTDCDDYVSPKIEVNLRGEPSTSEGNATIHVRLEYGEKAHRTGYSGTGSTEEDGWSRVEYNGEVLYAKTSYLFVVDETQQAEE